MLSWNAFASSTVIARLDFVIAAIQPVTAHLPYTEDMSLCNIMPTVS